MRAAGHRRPANQRRHDRRARIKAEHGYRVNQLALACLIAWHRDAHGTDCRCVEQAESHAERTLTARGHDPTPRPEPAPPAEGEPVPVHTA